MLLLGLFECVFNKLQIRDVWTNGHFRAVDRTKSVRHNSIYLYPIRLICIHKDYTFIRFNFFFRNLSPIRLKNDESKWIWWILDFWLFTKIISQKLSKTRLNISSLTTISFWFFSYNSKCMRKCDKSVNETMEMVKHILSMENARTRTRTYIVWNMNKWKSLNE